MSEIIKRLAEIQKVLKAPKNQFNEYGKYKYRSCEDILEAVKPLLDGIPLTISDEMVLIGDRYYIKAVVTFGYISVTAYAREEEHKKGMDASQITGSASSYARKYALNGLFLIDDTKDADATNKHGKEGQKQEKKSEPKPEVKYLQSGSKDHKALEAKIGKEKFGRDTFKEYLYSINWIAETDGEPSLLTLTEERARKMIIPANWEKMVAKVNEFIQKQQQ